MPKIGTYLRQAREKQGLRIADVVIMSNRRLDTTLLYGIERGERNLSFKTAYLLSEIYGIDLKDLCQRELRRQGFKFRNKRRLK